MLTKNTTSYFNAVNFMYYMFNVLLDAFLDFYTTVKNVGATVWILCFFLNPRILCMVVLGQPITLRAQFNSSAPYNSPLYVYMYVCMWQYTFVSSM